MTDNTKLTSLILAVDRINSWVRSKSFADQFQWNGQQFKRAFYFFKRETLKAAHTAGLVMFRGVHAVATCRDCSGTGQYVDMDGYKWPHCRECGSTGKVKLNFIEAHIETADDPMLTRKVIWHNPEGHGRNAFGTSVGYYMGSSLVNDWQPKTPGMDMPLAEAIKLVNFYESEILLRPEDYHLQYDDDWDGPHNDFGYHWPLGESPFAPAKACEFCGESDPEALTNFHVSRHLLEWRGLACKRCDVEPGSGKIYERFALAPSLLSQDVKDWQHRHADFLNRKLDKDSKTWEEAWAWRKEKILPIPLL